MHACENNTEYLQDDYEKPEREEFDSDEEYKIALTEYEEERERERNRWFDCGYDIEDPGDVKRLIDSFNECVYPPYASSAKHFTVSEFGDRITRCDVSSLHNQVTTF